MSPLTAILLLVTVSVVAIALDLLVLWVWRQARRAKQKAPVRRTAKSRARAAAGPPEPRVIQWLLAAEATFRRGIAAVRRAARVARRMLRDEQTKLRSVVVAACVLTSLSLGYVSADEVMVQPWLPWAWIACVVVALLALLPPGRPRFNLAPEDRWIFAIVAAAVLLRGIALERIPGALHVDEWGDAEYTLRYVLPPLERTLSPFVTGHSTQPALYFYLTRLSIAVFGERIAGLRMTSVVGGSLAILASYALISMLHNRKAGYLAAGLMAAYHFHIHWSRVGLNNIWDTFWVPTILALFVWGWRHDRPAASTFSGLALGLSQYFYAGSRIGIFLVAYLVIRAWRERGDDSRLVRHLARLIGMAAVVAIPLAVFAAAHPEAFFSRLYTGLLWDPFSADPNRAPPAYLPSVPQQFVWTLLSFTALPEGAGFYRPGVPLVIGLGAPLLLAGVLWQIQRREWTPVLWLALTMLFGGFFLQALPASNHYTVAIPAICWLIVSPLEALYSLGKPRWALAGLVVLIATDLYFYFGIYSRAPALDFVHPFPPNPYP